MPSRRCSARSSSPSFRAAQTNRTPTTITLASERTRIRMPAAVSTRTPLPATAHTTRVTIAARVATSIQGGVTVQRSWIRLSIVLLAVVGVLAVPAAGVSQPAEKTPTAEGTGGAAATVDFLATHAAIEALRDGANAVDAAVVAAAV